MPLAQRFPFIPRLLVATMSVLLVSVVGATFATAQSSEPVSTGPLTAPAATDGLESGESVRVSGAGYAPGASVDITIESTPTLLKTVTTDATGSFSTTVVIPATFPGGQHTLKATGADPAGGLRVLSLAVAVAGDAAGSGLPRTGTDTFPLVGVAVAGIAVGAAILIVRRRQAA